MTLTNVQVLFQRVPQGLPKRQDFEIVEKSIPDIGPSQFLIENQFLSRDP